MVKSVHYIIMFILFVRAIILYLLVFVVIRLSGKRQISDLQPFDLVITLLVADVASVPASDTGMPLAYGVVPILALFLVQQLFAWLSLKYEGFRNVTCGAPLLVIIKGVVQEPTLRSARYTLNDLMEQLRAKDVFEIADVEYAILETNGQLSVLLKGSEQSVTYKALGLEPPAAVPPYMVVQDGKVHEKALRQSGYDQSWLMKKLAKAGIKGTEELLFAFISGGKLHLQTKSNHGARAIFLDCRGEK